MKFLPFDIAGQQGQARAATLKTSRGDIKTPVFMPVGTQGAIRGLSPQLLPQTNSQIILANTYHLSQRPGAARWRDSKNNTCIVISDQNVPTGSSYDIGWPTK